MAAVNDIFEKLWDKHNEKYSPEQLREPGLTYWRWKNMTLMKSHKTSLFSEEGNPAQLTPLLGLREIN